MAREENLGTVFQKLLDSDGGGDGGASSQHKNCGICVLEEEEYMYEQSWSGLTMEDSTELNWRSMCTCLFIIFTACGSRLGQRSKAMALAMEM
jgi:hypothetical protein